MSKDTIEKIDEEIQNILGEEKNIKKEKKEKEEAVLEKVVEDTEDTKKIDSITDIEDKKEVEEVVEEKVEEKKVVPERKDSLSLTQALIVPKEKEEDKKAKVNIYLLLVGAFVILFILLFVIILVVRQHNKPVSHDSEKHYSSSEQRDIITGFGDTIQGLVVTYYNKQQKLLTYDEALELMQYDFDVVCNVHEIYEDRMIYLDDCSIDQQSTKYSYGTKEEETVEAEPEGTIHVYVSKKNKSATLEEPSNKENYDDYSFVITESYSKLTFLGDKNPTYVFYYDMDGLVHMINFKTGEKALESLGYDAILPIMVGDEYDQEYVGVEKYGNWGFASLKTGELTVSNRYHSVIATIPGMKYSKYHFIDTLEDGIVPVSNYYEVYGGFAVDYGVINYKTGEVVIPLKYKQLQLSGNYLVGINGIDNNQEVHIYDFSGKEYTFDSYGRVYSFLAGKYVLVQDKDAIKLVSINDKEIYNFGNVGNVEFSYGMNYMDGVLYRFVDADTREECYELSYDPETKEGDVRKKLCGRP